MFIAEREGFEPPEPRSSTVFKTAVIDHSTTSPDFVTVRNLLAGSSATFNAYLIPMIRGCKGK